MKTSKQKLSGSQGQPQAWIAIQKNRQKKHTQKDATQHDQVYLKDEQEFEIELYNPTKFPTLVKIKINGNYISNRGLILNPGQRWFLDRYIDNDRKFSFATYEIEDSEESKEATSHNGLVEIEFYAETQNFGSSGITWTKPYWEQDWSRPNIFYSDSTGSAGNPSFTTTTTSIGNFSTDDNTLDISASSSNATFDMLNSNVTYSSAIDISDGKSKVTLDSLNSSEKTVETGRVQEGEKSDQSFEEGSGIFNSYTSNICTYKIMPLSTKPIEKSEIRRYCPECGSRVRKSSWKFCPSCGEDLQ